MSRIKSDMHISSNANPRVKTLVKLRNRHHRDRDGRLLIEGYRELYRALDAGIAVDVVYFCEGFFLGENEAALIERARSTGAQTVSLTKEPFAKISYRDRPDGLIATAPQIHASLSDLSVPERPLLIVAQSIEKPGNLGTILRSADAVGVDAVLVCDGTTDINNPNVVRASTGTLFTVPIVECTGDEAIGWLKERGIPLLAATPHASDIYTDVNMADGCAIAVGAEQYGLTDEWLSLADLRVRIPMAGVADSLNVSAATTVLLFEAARQRGFPQKTAKQDTATR